MPREEETVEQFFTDINQIPMKQFEEDKWLWKSNNEGLFTAKNVYSLLHNASSGVVDNLFSLLWKLKAPSKAIVFTWRLVLNRIETYDQLLKRNIITYNTDSTCVLCGLMLKSANHLIFSYDFSYHI